VQYEIPGKKAGEIRREKKSLQELIDRMEKRDKNMTFLSVKYRIADPRKQILETAKVLNQQLELLARIQGEIKDVSINIVNSPVWINIQQVLLEVTDGMPEVRKKIADKLSSIAKSSGNT
jgi:hypothetical protein